MSAAAAMSATTDAISLTMSEWTGFERCSWEPTTVDPVTHKPLPAWYSIARTTKGGPIEAVEPSADASPVKKPKAIQPPTTLSCILSLTGTTFDQVGLDKVFVALYTGGQTASPISYSLISLADMMAPDLGVPAVYASLFAKASEFESWNPYKQCHVVPLHDDQTPPNQFRASFVGVRHVKISIMFDDAMHAHCGRVNSLRFAAFATSTPSFPLGPGRTILSWAFAPSDFLLVTKALPATPEILIPVLTKSGWAVHPDDVETLKVSLSRTKRGTGRYVQTLQHTVPCVAVSMQHVLALPVPHVHQVWWSANHPLYSVLLTSSSLPSNVSSMVSPPASPLPLAMAAFAVHHPLQASLMLLKTVTAPSHSSSAEATVSSHSSSEASVSTQSIFDTNSE